VWIFNVSSLLAAPLIRPESVRSGFLQTCGLFKEKYARVNYDQPEIRVLKCHVSLNNSFAYKGARLQRHTLRRANCTVT